MNTAVTFIWTFQMNFFNLLGKSLILCSSAAELASDPLVVGGPGNVKQLTSVLNRVSCFRMAFFYGCVDMSLPYL